jgi:hypothetical protein
MATLQLVYDQEQSSGSGVPVILIQCMAYVEVGGDLDVGWLGGWLLGGCLGSPLLM